jgi:hypothetical protein
MHGCPWSRSRPRGTTDNLLCSDAVPVAGTLLAEEGRHPELLAAFRDRLPRPRRALLR